MMSIVLYCLLAVMLARGSCKEQPAVVRFHSLVSRPSSGGSSVIPSFPASSSVDRLDSSDSEAGTTRMLLLLRSSLLRAGNMRRGRGAGSWVEPVSSPPSPSPCPRPDSTELAESNTDVQWRATSLRALSASTRERRCSSLMWRRCEQNCRPPLRLLPRRPDSGAGAGAGWGA